MNDLLRTESRNLTVKELEVLNPLFEALKEGKTIEYKIKERENWIPVMDYIPLNIELYEYRIKPEPKYRPFKDAQECWEEMQKHQPFGWISNKRDPDFKECIVSIDDECIMLVDFSDDKTICFSYKDSYEYYTFTDGTPFGKLEE